MKNPLKDNLPTIIYRHRKENLKKCTLSPLEKKEDFAFYTYPKESLPNLNDYILLHMEGAILSKKDKDMGIICIDATWRYAEKIAKLLPEIPKRSLPSSFRTAYPRKQTGCIDPRLGLASIEALYVAFLLTGRSTKGLLDHYHWKETFIQLNHLDTFDD